MFLGLPQGVEGARDFRLVRVDRERAAQRARGSWTIAQAQECEPLGCGGYRERRIRLGHGVNVVQVVIRAPSVAARTGDRLPG